MRRTVFAHIPSAIRDSSPSAESTINLPCFVSVLDRLAICASGLLATLSISAPGSRASSSALVRIRSRSIPWNAHPTYPRQIHLRAKSDMKPCHSRKLGGLVFGGGGFLSSSSDAGIASAERRCLPEVFRDRPFFPPTVLSAVASAESPSSGTASAGISVGSVRSLNCSVCGCRIGFGTSGFSDV